MSGIPDSIAHAAPREDKGSCRIDSKKARPHSSSTLSKSYRRPPRSLSGLDQSMEKTTLEASQKLSPRKIMEDEDNEPAVKKRHAKGNHERRDSEGGLKSFVHSTPVKSYRVNEQDVYNYVRNSVFETFKTQNTRNYDLIKELTGSSHSFQIDRLCQKFSILRNPVTSKKKSFESDTGTINVEEITNHYVKSRSKERQRN